MTLVTAMPRAGLPVLSAIPVPGNRPIPPLRQRRCPTGIDDERCYRAQVSRLDPGNAWDIIRAQMDVAFGTLQKEILAAR